MTPHQIQRQKEEKQEIVNAALDAVIDAYETWRHKHKGRPLDPRKFVYRRESVV